MCKILRGFQNRSCRLIYIGRRFGNYLGSWFTLAVLRILRKPLQELLGRWQDRAGLHERNEVKNVAALFLRRLIAWSVDLQHQIFLARFTANEPFDSFEVCEGSGQSARR